MTIDSGNMDTRPSSNKPAIEVADLGKGKQLVPIFADVLADVAIELTVRLGSGTLSVKELLALKEGASVVLDMPLNGIVDVCLNEAVVARGEIVAAGDHYGIRLTEVAELQL